MSRKNLNEFTFDEEKCLNQLVEIEFQTPPINWKKIASDLNSRFNGNKTAKECQTYYRNRLQPGHLKTKLSKEDEDVLLWAAHEERSEGKIRWTEIAKFFPNRYIFKSLIKLDNPVFFKTGIKTILKRYFLYIYFI